MISYLRYDFKMIANLVQPETRVLDLGCGDGSLLKYLKDEKEITPYGIEISKQGIEKCIEKGVPVFNGDIDQGLSDYNNNSFEYVVLSQTLQETKKPYNVLKEMVRVGRKGIISFPNFGYFRIRLYLLLKGNNCLSEPRAFFSLI